MQPFSDSPRSPAPALSGDHAGRVLSQALSELVRVIQFRDRDRACCHDISVSQCYALKAVADGGPLTVNELAGALYLDKSTASRVANGLVGLGLLELAREYGELLADFEPEVRSALVTLVERLTRSFTDRVLVEGGSCCVVRAPG